jgi:hypothetical protein
MEIKSTKTNYLKPKRVMGWTFIKKNSSFNAIDDKLQANREA